MADEMTDAELAERLEMIARVHVPFYGDTMREAARRLRSVPTAGDAEVARETLRKLVRYHEPASHEFVDAHIDGDADVETLTAALARVRRETEDRVMHATAECVFACLRGEGDYYHIMKAIREGGWIWVKSFVDEPPATLPESGRP